MNRKAVLFLAAVMTAGSTVSAAAAETFADINDVPWGGAQAYINSVFEKGLMVGDIDDSGRRVFRARDNISYNETVQLVYTLSGKTVSDEVINKWAADMRSNNIPRWAYDSVAFALEAGIITRSDLAVFVNADQSVPFRGRRGADGGGRTLQRWNDDLGGMRPVCRSSFQP